MIIPVIGAFFGNRFIGPSSENLSFLNILQRIIWPGKGLGTGWEGFKEEKFIIALSGMSEYLIGGQNLNNIPSILMTDHFRRMLFCLGILFFLGIIFLNCLFPPWY